MKKDAHKPPNAAKLCRAQVSRVMMSNLADSKRAGQILVGTADDKFRIIFDHSNDGIVLADPENKKFYTANNAFYRMLGYSLDEIKNLGIMDIHPEKDLPYVVEQFERQVRGGGLAKDIPVKRKDGSVFYADINTTVIAIAGKKYMAGFFHDTTQRKQAEKTLLESEKKYRQLVETLQEGVWSIDTDFNTTFVNPCMAEMLGYSVAEMLGKPLRNFMDEGNFAIVINYQERRKQGVTNQYDLAFIRKDGSQIYTSLTATPLTDEAGVFIGALASVVDITNRKQSEQALLFKTMLLEAQSETSIDGILAVDDEGHVILFNHRFGELWQIPRHVLDTKDDAKLLAYVANQLKDPAEFSRRITYLYEHKDEKSQDEINFVRGMMHALTQEAQ